MRIFPMSVVSAENVTGTLVWNQTSVMCCVSIGYLLYAPLELSIARAFTDRLAKV